MPNIAYLQIKITAPYEALAMHNAYEMLLALVHNVRTDFRNIQATDAAEHTYIQQQRYWFSRPDAFCEKMYGLKHVLPIMPSPDPDEEIYHVGFLLPISEFGGVEKVAFNYASVLKAAGCHVHLFLVGRNRALIPSQFEGLFSTVTFFQDTALNSYKDASEFGGDYLGCGVPQWNKHGKVEQAIGMLMPMNAVINFQVPTFNTIMAPLRKFGVKTFTSQHLVDQSWIGQPIGSPHQFIAYEHAYDGALCISHQLMAEFKGLGVPQQKLIYVPNAASYAVNPKKIHAIMAERQKRPADQPLRVLYIGRFDRQKGLDRLVGVIERTQASHMPIEWRVVGKDVLGDAGQYIDGMRPYLHPLATTPNELTEHFAWADVMVLPSRFEGVPLTILEAGQLGCISLATDVGAVEEIIKHGETGFVIDSTQDDDVIVRRFCQVLGALSDDREMLRQLAIQAHEHYGAFSWTKSLRPFLDLLPLPAQKAVDQRAIA